MPKAIICQMVNKIAAITTNKISIQVQTKVNNSNNLDCKAEVIF